MAEENKYLKFNEKQIPKIFSGDITKTIRIFDEKDLSEGDQIVLIAREDGDEFARADLTEVYEKKFGDINAEDLKGQDQYKSLISMQETFRNYYGDEVNDETPVKVIGFKLI